MSEWKEVTSQLLTSNVDTKKDSRIKCGCVWVRDGEDEWRQNGILLELGEVTPGCEKYEIVCLLGDMIM